MWSWGSWKASKRWSFFIASNVSDKIDDSSPERYRFLLAPSASSGLLKSSFLFFTRWNEWDNRLQPIQQPIIAEQRLSQYFSNFTDYCPLYRGSISAEITLQDREKVSTEPRCPLCRGSLPAKYVPSDFEMSTIRRCPLYGGVHYTEVSTIERCPLWGVLL